MNNTQTPWGVSQETKVIAEGITRYDTASHGGYRLSEERLRTMPSGLREQRTFNGHVGWYEEDCDWAIVALAFPEHFDDRAIYYAVETVRGSSEYMALARRWLESCDAKAQALRARANDFQKAPEHLKAGA